MAHQVVLTAKRILEIQQETFADDVEAIVVLFLAGASTGTATARVLFGDVNPSAKSPVTFPVSEDDVPPPPVAPAPPAPPPAPAPPVALYDEDELD